MEILVAIVEGQHHGPVGRRAGGASQDRREPGRGDRLVALVVQVAELRGPGVRGNGQVAAGFRALGNLVVHQDRHRQGKSQGHGWLLLPPGVRAAAPALRPGRARLATQPARYPAAVAARPVTIAPARPSPDTSPRAASAIPRATPLGSTLVV